MAKRFRKKELRKKLRRKGEPKKKIEEKKFIRRARQEKLERNFGIYPYDSWEN